jgi:transposase
MQINSQLPRGAHVQADAQAEAVAAEGAAVTPQGRPGSAGALVKKGLQRELGTIARAHPGRRLTLWFQDEARFGQKGRTCHRWFTRGQRPSGLCDQRYTWTHLFAAVQPKTGGAFALVLPELNTAAMQLFLDRFAANLATNEHAALVMDQAGWHVTNGLLVPANVSLVMLPSYSPELNPVERVWLYLRERYLSHRLLNSYNAIVDALCTAWQKLTATELQSLTSYPYLNQVRF